MSSADLHMNIEPSNMSSAYEHVKVMIAIYNFLDAISLLFLCGSINEN
jgi:hypothetical protein